MARIRTIKPEFPQSESMGRVSRDARLLFVMLWPICDDHGRTRAATRMLASLLFPYDDDAPSLIEGWLDELEDEGCIRRYIVEGSTYLEVCNWLFHQKIDRPSRPLFPRFDEGSPKAREGSRRLVLGMEGKGEEGRGEDQQHARASERAAKATSTHEVDDAPAGLKLPITKPPNTPLDERSGPEQAEGALSRGSAPDRPSAPATARPIRPEVLLGKALIAMGVTGVNNTRPEFTAAVASGVLPEDIPPIAEEFPGKPAKYLLQVAITRRREGAAVPAASTRVAPASRQLATEAANVAAGEVVKARIRAEALARGEPIE